MSFWGTGGYQTVTFSLEWRMLHQVVNIFHLLWILVLPRSSRYCCVLRQNQAPVPRSSITVSWLLLLSRFSRVWLCDPRDGSPPGPAVPGILQARTLEWVAISSSNAWKWKVKVKSLSYVRLPATPWTAAHQASPSVGLSRQEHWSVSAYLPFPSLISYCLSLSFDTQGRSWRLKPIPYKQETGRAGGRGWGGHRKASMPRSPTESCWVSEVREFLGLNCAL